MNFLQEKITAWMQGKEAVTVTVCAVLKNLNQDRLKSPLAKNKNIKQYCKNVLLNKVVSIGTVVNLLDSKLAIAYGICYVVIQNYEPLFDEGTKPVIITQRTCIQIEAVQSEDFYNLRLNVTPVTLGGLSHDIEQLSLLLNYNKSHNNSLLRPVGVLLHGPSGCGKTSLAEYLAHICNAVFIKLEGSNILQSDFATSAESLNKHFQRAVSLSKEGSVILFIDEIDPLCPGLDYANLGNKLTSALASEMDSLHQSNESGLLVFAATNFISSVSATLRRPGCFDQEMLINVPSKQQRTEILTVYTADVSLASDVSLSELASLTIGFVGADLVALCDEAVNHAHSSNTFQEAPVVCMSHFVHALHTVRPSLKKGLGCVVELQSVKWEEIGGLEEVKAEIIQSVEWPMLYPDAFRRLDLSATKGILLYGPPGCCKTTLVRAVATSCNVAFLTLSGAQVYSPYVGESERIISEAFQKARALSPAILFFDEIESIVGSRSSGSSHSRVQERILSTMLNEMAGVGIKLDRKMEASLARQREIGQKMIGNASVNNSHSTDNVSGIEMSQLIVIGATNRPDMIDPAILRPGRMDKLIYVPPPDLTGRQEILNIEISKMPAPGIDLEELSKKTEYFSGADLKNLCKEAGFIALRERRKRENTDISNLFVTSSHFAQALEIVKSSLTESMLQPASKDILSSAL